MIRGQTADAMAPPASANTTGLCGDGLVDIKALRSELYKRVRSDAVHADIAEQLANLGKDELV